MRRQEMKLGAVHYGDSPASFGMFELNEPGHGMESKET
jgi:hypothetical protein